MPQEQVLKQIEEMQTAEAAEQGKRRVGRPKGAKDKKPRKERVVDKTAHMLVDPKTGIVVRNEGQSAAIIGRIGDERVSQFVLYHMEMMKMREGCNTKDVPDLYQRFYRYLAYCAEHAIVPNNMNAYYAIGVDIGTISSWKSGAYGTPEQQKFAKDITGFFASVHEQAPTEGLMNPISAMFWQKAHDGMIEASKLEVVNQDPLGDRKSAEDIAKAYSEVELPD